MVRDGNPPRGPVKTITLVEILAHEQGNVSRDKYGIVARPENTTGARRSTCLAYGLGYHRSGTPLAVHTCAKAR